jgi:hypothetical protein
METGRMNAPSLSCRCAIAPFPLPLLLGRDREAIRATPSSQREKNFAI